MRLCLRGVTPYLLTWIGGIVEVHDPLRGNKMTSKHHIQTVIHQYLSISPSIIRSFSISPFALRSYPTRSQNAPAIRCLSNSPNIHPNPFPAVCLHHIKENNWRTLKHEARGREREREEEKEKIQGKKEREGEKEKKKRRRGGRKKRVTLEFAEVIFPDVFE